MFCAKWCPGLCLARFALTGNINQDFPSRSPAHAIGVEIMNMGLPEGWQSPRQGQAGREMKVLAPLTSHKMQMHCPDSTTGKQGEIIVPPRPALGSFSPTSAFPCCPAQAPLCMQCFSWGWQRKISSRTGSKIFSQQNSCPISHLCPQLASIFPATGGWPSSPAGVMPQLLVCRQWITPAMNSSAHTPAFPLCVSRPLTHAAIHHS